jgi:CRISPR-associated endoribonuclease Cas6
MIFTPEISTTKSIQLAGVALVLRPVPPSKLAVSLFEWIDDDQLIPFWVPLAPQKGMTKVMPVLSQPQSYPALFQAICQQMAIANTIEWQGRHYEITGLETLTDSMYAIQLSLFHQRPLNSMPNRALHGMLLQWFANADQELAEHLHQAEHPPFTIVAKPQNRQQLQVRLTVLQPELLSPLLWGLCPYLGQEVLVMDVPCQMTPQVQIVASNSYGKLAQVSPQDSLELEFITPTSFKQKDCIQTFPLPELVFGSLLRRWNVFAPEDLRFDEIDWKGMIARYEMHSSAMKMHSDELGGQGWVKYHFADSEQLAIATVLAHFATFAGVGRKTTMGMGQAHLRSKSSAVPAKRKTATNGCRN